jgi:hypothetical protein
MNTGRQLRHQPHERLSRSYQGGHVFAYNDADDRHIDAEVREGYGDDCTVLVTDEY